MNTICGIEDIILEDDAKDFIVSVSNNSIRTLINYIEKISLLNNNNKAEIKKVKQICTNICFDNFEHYIQLCINNETDNAFEYILSIYNLGFSVVDIYDNFFIFVKSSEVVNETLKYEIIKLLCKYITIFHNIHEHEIELLLFTKEIITMFHA